MISVSNAKSTPAIKAFTHFASNSIMNAEVQPVNIKKCTSLSTGNFVDGICDPGHRTAVIIISVASTVQRYFNVPSCSGLSIYLQPSH